MLAVETRDGGGFFPDEGLPDPADVMVVCSSLISYYLVTDKDNDDGSESGDVDDDANSDNTPAQAMMLRLAYFSVKEYLCRTATLFTPNFNPQSYTSSL